MHSRLDEACGDDPEFTGAQVLSELPISEVTAPLLYERDRELYPESLPDTTVTVRVVYEGGYVVCRIPSPTQPAIDMAIILEWMTEDGAFDEGLHAYLRRNNFGFLHAFTTVASAPAGGLDGSYDPSCLDPNGFGFSAQFNDDGSVVGSVSKACEIDIGLDVGSFEHTP